MAQARNDESMVKYQFQADPDEWTAWKNTVPRSKSLETRVNELIRADTEGRVTAVDLDAVRDDLTRALEHREWAAVEDALARLEADDAE